MAAHARMALIAVALFSCPTLVQAADDQAEAAELVKKLAEGTTTERDDAEQKLRKIGKPAIAALRDAKTEKEEATNRVRGALTDIVLSNAKNEEEDAKLIHEIAREEGKGKRYSNAERLYTRAEQTYDILKDIADKRKEKDKEREFASKQKICDRMKDKAGHKMKGDTHTGVNLGFVRVGKDHDMSDDWE